MMWGYFDGATWLWMAATMVVSWGVVIGLTVYAIRAFNWAPRKDQAMDVLGRRLASGDITREDYEKTRKALHG